MIDPIIYNNLLRSARNSSWSESCSAVLIGIVAGILKPSYNSTINNKMINSTIAREIVSGILLPRSTYNIITTVITSSIARGRVYGLKRPMSTS